jgi:hypothetical protein
MKPPSTNVRLGMLGPLGPLRCLEYAYGVPIGFTSFEKLGCSRGLTSLLRRIYPNPFLPNQEKAGECPKIAPEKNLEILLLQPSLE